MFVSACTLSVRAFAKGAGSGVPLTDHCSLPLGRLSAELDGRQACIPLCARLLYRILKRTAIWNLEVQVVSSLSNGDQAHSRAHSDSSSLWRELDVGRELFFVPSAKLTWVQHGSCDIGYCSSKARPGQLGAVRCICFDAREKVALESWSLMRS